MILTLASTVNYKYKRVFILKTNSSNNSLKEKEVIFQKNLLLFKKFLPEIFFLYNNYTPKNTYLETDDNGNFNLKNSGSFIYPNNPKTESEKQVDLYFDTPLRYQYIPYDSVIPDQKHNFINETYIMKIHNYLISNKKYAPSSKDLHEYIPTMVILGVGLGYHIEKIFKEHTIDVLHIYEPNTDIFYWTMHNIDYKEILEFFAQEGKCLLVEIGEESGHFINNIKKKSNDIGFHSSIRIYVYRHYQSEEINSIFDRISKYIHRNFNGWGFFEDELIAISHTLKNIQKNKFVIKNDIKNIFKLDIPAIIIGNGPSLDKEIDFIKKNQENMILISCGSTLTSLHKHKIIPDFHVEIERTKVVFDWIKNINDDSYTKKIILLGINTIYPDTSDFFHSFYWLYKSGDSGESVIKNYFNDIASLSHTNPTVVNGGIAIAAHLGFKEIILAGVDMGFKEPTYHHSQTSDYYNKNSGFYKEKENIHLKIKGNFQEELFTTLEFDQSKFTIETKLKENPQIICYNISDGAKIMFTQSIKSEHLEIKNTTIEKKALIEKLISIKTQELITESEISVENLKSNIVNLINHDIDIIIKETESFFKIENRIELSKAMHIQYDKINKKSDINFGDSTRKIIIGSIIHMHTVVFSHMVDVTDRENFKDLIKNSIQYFINYLEEMKLLSSEIINHYY